MLHAGGRQHLCANTSGRAAPYGAPAGVVSSVRPDVGRDSVPSTAADGALFHERLRRRDGAAKSAVSADEPDSYSLLGGSVSAYADLDLAADANLRLLSDRRVQLRAAHSAGHIHGLVPALVSGTLCRQRQLIFP